MDKTLLRNSISQTFWPLVIGLILSNMLTVVDAMMVSNYDEYATSGISVLLQTKMIIMPVFFAIVSGIGIYSNQYYGAKDYDSMKKVFSLNFTLALIIGIISCFSIYIFSDQIINIFIKDDPVSVGFANDYLLFFCLNFIFWPINFLFSYQYRYVKKNKLATRINLSTVILNTILNFFLIFGFAGFPELGIMGASLATFISNVVFVVFNIIYSSKKNIEFMPKISNLIRFDRNLFSMVISKVKFLIVTELFFGLSRVLTTYIYSLVSVEALTADRIAFNLMMIPNSFVMAAANTGSVIVGRALGEEKDPSNVKAVSDYINKFLFLISTFVLVISFTILPASIYLFGLSSEEIISISVAMIQINGIFLAIRMFSTGYSFIMRSGGDTKFIMIIDILTTYLVAIPLSFIAVLVFNGDAIMVKWLSIVDISIKAIFMSLRFRTYKWMKKVI